MIEYTLPIDKKRASTTSYAMEPKALEELVETQRPNFLKAIEKRAAPYMLALGITGLAAVAARADITIPFIEPATTITLTNPTQETVTGNIIYKRIDDAATGTATIPYSIPPGGSVNPTNPVTTTITQNGPHATVVPDVDPATGKQFSDPEVNVVTCDNGNGYTLPTWTSQDLENTKPMSGVGVTGLEWLIIASGDQECTVTLEYYGRNGNGPFYSTPLHFGPHTTSLKPLNAFEGGVDQNSPFTVLLDSASQSNGRVAELRVDDTTLDKSVSDLKPYTPEKPPVILGIDINGDGVPDWVDADHDGLLDGTSDISCNLPFSWVGDVIVSPPGQYTYSAYNMPQTMVLNQGTGEIDFNPSCDQDGQNYTIGLTASNGVTTTPPVYAPFHVTQ